MEIQTIRAIPAMAFSSSLLLSGVLCVIFPSLDGTEGFFIMSGIFMVPWVLWYWFETDNKLKDK